MKIHEILSIEPDRWCQFTLQSDDGRRRCLIGHLQEKHSMVFSNRNVDAYGEDLEKLKSLVPVQVHLWNDTIGRTVAEVIELCKKADV